MSNPLKGGHMRLGAEVEDAVRSGKPVVALETAVVTHGLPSPDNLEIVDRMEAEIRARGAIPATCLVLQGVLHVGADWKQLTRAANDPARRKASVRDLGAVIAAGCTAGLTVSATLSAAHQAGIQVFSTGGIGGVHLDAPSSFDISADLLQLTRSRVVTVCAGAKSVLDIPKTLEYLETIAVPVYCFGADSFPAFYARSSGIACTRIDSVSALATTVTTQWAIGYGGGQVVANPIAPNWAISAEQWTSWLRAATDRAEVAGIHGQAVTPYLLAAVADLSGGATVKANLELLAANAGLAADLAVALQR